MRGRGDFLPWRHRIEPDRRTHGVVERGLVQRLDALLLLLQAVEHQLAFLRIEVHAGDFFGAGNRFDGDVRTSADLRPKHSGEKSRAKTEAGEVRHEATTVDSWHAALLAQICDFE